MYIQKEEKRLKAIEKELSKSSTIHRFDDEVFKKLKLPKKIEDIIKSYWIYFGVSTLNMNFAHYIYLFYELIEK